MSTNYIEKDVFFDMIKEYQRRCKQAEEENKPRPQIPDDLGAVFLRVAQGIAMRPNWRDYTYVDEMVNDALEACCKAVRSFDTSNEKKNPFGYFSRTVWNAFLQRLKKEKRQTYVKFKSHEQFVIESSLAEGDYDASPTMDLSNDKMKPIIEMFEGEKKKKKTSGVERFIGLNEDK